MATKKTTVTTTEDDGTPDEPKRETYGLKPTSTVPEIMAVLDGITKKATDESRNLTEDEVFAFEDVEKQLAARQKSDELYRRQEARKSFIVDNLPNIIKPQPKGEEAEYAKAFDDYLRFGDNSDLRGMRFAQTEGTPSEGGYAVPTEFTSRLIERRVAYGGLMNAAQNITTPDGRPIDWAVTVDDTSSSRADVVAEGAASIVGADLTFGTVSLGAYRYAATGTGNIPIKVSVELAQDATFDIGAFVARALGKRIARKQAKDILQASGSGEPEGLMYGTAGTIESDVLSGTTAQNTVALNNLVHALDIEYRSTASWIMNDKTAAGIEAMLDAAGRPLLSPSTQGIASNIAKSTLFGYPVIIDQAAHDVDTNDVIGIAFGDWSEAYIVRHVRDVQVLVNPYAVTGYVVYDAWARMDGKIQNAWAYVTGEGV